MLKTGDLTPPLSLATDNRHFSLAEQRGKKVVVFFFPRADTSGCTKQATQFSTLRDEFLAINTVVIGISKDTPSKLAKFRVKYKLTCLLGADHETDWCEQFGVWVEKVMYGKKHMGIQRSTFIIASDGRISAIWPAVKVDGHAKEVLNTLKKNSSTDKV
jgi:peroxiredoxin Q/BCP